MQKILRPNFIQFYGQSRYHICTIFLFDEMSLLFQNLMCINFFWIIGQLALSPDFYVIYTKFLGYEMASPNLIWY